MSRFLGPLTSRAGDDAIAQAVVLTGSVSGALVYEGAPEGHTRRIVDIVVADNPIERRPLR